jgi:hypothetical protein
MSMIERPQIFYGTDATLANSGNGNIDHELRDVRLGRKVKEDLSLLINRSPLETDRRDLLGVADLLADKERQVAVEQWRNAPAIIQKFRSGIARDKEGHALYRYPAGENLFIRNEPVMSSAEAAWSRAAVELGFRELQRYNNVGPYGVVEIGTGQLHTTRKIAQFLNVYGGWYDGIELNTDTFRRARNWATRYNEAHDVVEADLPGQEQRPPIHVYHGDAVRALITRARKITQGREQPADMFILDSYPISENEKKGEGTHDLGFLALVKMCLKDDGIVVWYPWFEGSNGGVTAKQEELIGRHFRSSAHLSIPNPRRGFHELRYAITPDPTYPYLWQNGNPVRQLPIGYAQDPIR